MGVGARLDVNIRPESLCRRTTQGQEQLRKGSRVTKSPYYSYMKLLLYIHVMWTAVMLCRAKGIFELYAGMTDISSSGLELSDVAFQLEVADLFDQIVTAHAALTGCFR